MKAFLLPLFAAACLTQLPLGCSSNSGDGADGGTCAPGVAVVYTSPGCGASAAPVCESGAPDACGNQSFCGCDGVTFVGGCGVAQKPYEHGGACEDGAPPDSGHRDSATHDSAITDSGMCETGVASVYIAPGCGTSAVPVCESGAPDACGNQSFCGCDGVTFVGGCGVAQKPYEHAGACDDSAPPDSGLGGG